MTQTMPTTCELLRRYRSGDASPRAETDALIERIVRHDPALHAFVSVYAEAARDSADAAERALRRGYPLGCMSGVPFALKDIIDVAGQPTVGGCPAYAQRVSSQTATVAQRLLAAGGVLMGKTHTVELAMGGWGTNQHFGTPVNPWDRTRPRTPGASSSGSGVAVAAGLVPFAIGTDTGGSVRLPAAMNGIVGLKVTAGRIPTDGIMPLSHTLDTPGPMARSVEDCALGFEVLRGVEPHQTLSELVTGGGLFAELRRGVDGISIGTLAPEERAGVDAEVLAACDASVDRLLARGAIARPVALPCSYQEYRERAATIITAEGYHHHGALYEDPQVSADEQVRARFLSGAKVTVSDYISALQGQHSDASAFLDAIAQVDVLITPTVYTTARPLDDIDPAFTPARFTSIANYLRLCAISVPSGLSGDGLPTAVQIIARADQESLLLRVAAELERVAGGQFPVPDLDGS